MSIYVQTNVSSLQTNNYLSQATSSLDTIYERLSSGLRINSAKDDAAGLQISDRLTSQIDGLNQGNRNANDGIAVAQTIEGALDESTTMLQRIRTLAVQAANGTYTDEDRESIQAEVTQLCQEITRIACQTTYGGATVLNGSAAELLVDGTITFHVGSNEGDTISLNLTEGFTVASILKAVGVSSSATGICSDGTGSANWAFSLTTTEGAEAVISYIDECVSFVDSKRADLGAIETRLESAISTQTTTATNESDARSRIRDTDFAEEASNLSAQTIIQQAATSMLTQANSRSEIALTLLGG